MPLVQDLIKKLQTEYALNDVVAYSIWSTGDLQEFVDELPNLECEEDLLKATLERTHNLMDANQGINWEVPRTHFHDLVRDRQGILDDEFRCAKCEGIYDNDNSIAVDGELLCPLCACVERWPDELV